MYLYIDGARLGSALAVENSDLGFSSIVQYADMFYIGGTKNGALLGEAIVIINNSLKPEFRRHIKQRGGLLAKGRLLGLQFRELFRDGLYIELAQHANAMASKLTTGIRERGFTFLTESHTNQIFPIFPDAVIETLQENYGFYVWDKAGEGTSSIRLVTSWATKEEYVDEFLEDLGKVG